MDKLIIFDTNALFGLRRDTQTFDLLRAFKHASSQTVGIPWMVREELVAQQVIPYREAYEKSESAINSLNNRKPLNTPTANLPDLEIEAAKEFWRTEYGEVLVTIETSGENAKTALSREAYYEKPAKVDPKGKKEGGRDAAIWLTVVDYLKNNVDDEVFFVSSNYKDFGDGVHFPSPMAEDIAGVKSRLHFLATFEEFISHFTEKIEIDAKHIKEIISGFSSDSITPIKEYANTVLNGDRFEGTRIENGSFDIIEWQNWIVPPTVVVNKVVSATGHKIADDEWYTATVDWLLVGIAGLVASTSWQGSLSLTQVACIWRCNILFSTSTGRPIKVFSSAYPRALDASDREETQPTIDRATAAMDATWTSLTESVRARLAPSSVTISSTQFPNPGITIMPGAVPTVSGLTVMPKLFSNTGNVTIVPGGVPTITGLTIIPEFLSSHGIASGGGEAVEASDSEAAVTDEDQNDSAPSDDESLS